MSKAAILVVDDEPIIRDTLAEFLQQERYEVKTCASGEEALKVAESQLFDLVLCDINLPGMDGLEVLDRLLKISPETLVVLITAYATVETAVEAFQKGAHDYLTKPIILNDVLRKIQRLLAQRELHRENQWLRRELSREVENGEHVLGRTRAMQEAHAIARKVAVTMSTVLVVGESGTGKELMAHAVHRYAQAAKANSGRFIAVNCAAIPHDQIENQLFGHRRGAFTGAERDEPGVFVHAGPGTVFLDEIAELPLATQGKMLRAIDRKEIFPIGASEPVTVSARIVAATNKDLAAEVQAGRFREDLYYRLNVVTIALPPLRERREDIPELVVKLLAKHAKNIGKRFRGVSHEAMQLLLGHPWKGNIRELDNALQRAVILGDGPIVRVGDLPPDFRPNTDDPFAVDDLGSAIERFEKMHIERILRQATDKREAAKRLNIGVSSLYRKIEHYGLSADDR